MHLRRMLIPVIFLLTSCQSSYVGQMSDTEETSGAHYEQKEEEAPSTFIYESDTTPIDTDTEIDAGDEMPTTLFIAPLFFATTAHGFSVNAVVASGDADSLRLHVKPKGTEVWNEVVARRMPTYDVAEWTADGLQPGTPYDYVVSTLSIENLEQIFQVLFAGEVITQREPGDSFSFSLITDSHIKPRSTIIPGLITATSEEGTLLSVATDIQTYLPDFVLHLGDILDFHDFGFNQPPTTGSATRLGYINYRRVLGAMIGNTSHFLVIGNWEGENGDYTEEEIHRSLDQRLLYLPGPDQETYPESGSANEDYYAFQWGDALFIVLNVMTYTPTAHLLSSAPGLTDDWTLGEEQLDWFRETLENATSKWRFVCIHHTVGGAAGDFSNSAYGRGGGQAANVGEQAVIHDLMQQHGVHIFFYGHDHVFFDMVVDDVHYTLPGSAGAIWKFNTFETGYESYWPDSGHGRVTVTSDSVNVEFIAMGGEVLHSYTIED